MKREYKTVRTDTLAGLRAAEKLHESGWKQSRVGPFSTQFYRDSNSTAL